MNKLSPIFLSLLLFAFSSFGQMAIKIKGSDGWGQYDKYEQSFTHAMTQTFYGDVVSIDTMTPFPTMAYGIQLTTKVDGNIIPVHLGPAWYIMHQDGLAFSRDDRIEIKGARITLNGKPAIVASMIKHPKNRRTLFLRDNIGTPFWCSWRKNR
jgi:hypothetical protein